MGHTSHTAPKFLLLALAVAATLPAAPASGASVVALQVRKGGGNDARLSERLVEEGVAALERGDTASAADSFRRALSADASNATAHTYLGVLADRAGDLPAAEKHFAAAARVSPMSPTARNNYGAILLRRGRTREAAVEFEASLRQDARQASALVNLAQIRLAGGSPDSLRAARELFARADEIAPDASIARALVVISLKLGDAAEASRRYRDYTSRLAVAPPEVAGATARAELGAALLEASLGAEAVEELSAASAADPSNARTVVQLARAHLLRRDIPAAGRTLEGAVARGLDPAPVYAALADVYVQSGHIENAIPALRLAIQREPRSEEYPFRYAMLLVDTKAPLAAVIRMEEAVKKFPQSARIWFALGVAYFAAEKTAEAAKVFERVIALDPKLAPAHAYYALTFEDQGRYSEAIPFYEKALALDERIPMTHYLLAGVLLKHAPGETARPETHLKRALELDENFTLARLSLGRIYLRDGRVEEAARHLERVVAAEPELAEAHYQLGHAYRRLKRTVEAQAAFDRFKQLSDLQRDQGRDEQRLLARRLANVRF
jgi:Tfp pilus assembly protein PilF